MSSNSHVHGDGERRLTLQFCLVYVLICTSKKNSMIHVQIKIKKNFHVYIYMAMVFCFGSGVIRGYASNQTEK